MTTTPHPGPACEVFAADDIFVSSGANLGDGLEEPACSPCRARADGSGGCQYLRWIAPHLRSGILIDAVRRYYAGS
ncbi:hypothetical protein FAZ78_23050, partial [Cereibacter changlensis]